MSFVIYELYQLQKQSVKIAEMDIGRLFFGNAKAHCLAYALISVKVVCAYRAGWAMVILFVR